MKKAGLIIGIVVILAGVILGLFTYNGRERTLADILPEELGEDVNVLAGRAEEAVKLTKEQLQQLQEVLDQAAYKKVGTADGMGFPENYARVIWVANGKGIELMFSNQQGGRVLVNDMDSRKASPVYEIRPSGEKIETLLRSWLGAAAE